MASSEAVGVGSSVVVLAMSFNDCGLQTDSTNVVDVSNRHHQKIYKGFMT